MNKKIEEISVEIEKLLLKYDTDIIKFCALDSSDPHDLDCFHGEIIALIKSYLKENKE